MVNIFDEDYMENPNNRYYVNSARQLDMNWKDFKEMYEGLHEEPKKELDKYLVSIASMEQGQRLKKLIELEKHAKKSAILHPIKFGSAA